MHEEKLLILFEFKQDMLLDSRYKDAEEKQIPLDLNETCQRYFPDFHVYLMSRHVKLMNDNISGLLMLSDIYDVQVRATFILQHVKRHS